MYSRVISILLITSMIFIGCGGESGTSDKAEAKPETEKKEKLSLKTREGMMAMLEDVGITIPDFMEYEKVKSETGEYRILFKVPGNIDGAEQKIIDWMSAQGDKLIADGWNEGMRITQSEQGRHLRKKKGGSSTLHRIVTLDYFKEFQGEGFFVVLGYAEF